MKKLLALSPAKIYLLCALGLFLTLGSFWHHQVNQTRLDRMAVLNQGLSTCFNRISQTFTAMMIKDIQSPYLNREFMGLSDECLNETIKGINPFRQSVGKGYQTLNQLISEVHWFHEKVLKIHGPMFAGQTQVASLNPLTERFGKMENYKLDLIDAIETATAQLREVQMNDEILMGSGLIIFILTLTLLSLQEFNRQQLRLQVEREALNYLTTGKNNFGAIVDQLVDRALSSQGMPVTAQLFRDYHEGLLERMSLKVPAKKNMIAAEAVAQTETSVEAPVEEAPQAEVVSHKTSLKEIMVSVQNTQLSDTIHTEVRDVTLNVPYESFEQTVSAAINQLMPRRDGNKKIMISNQIHSDKSILNLFLAGSTFSVSELEYASNEAAAAEGLDMNLVILREMVRETGAQWHIENKTDRSGNITGMNIRFVVNRSPKERKNLISVMKGKKKDLAKELMN